MRRHFLAHRWVWLAIAVTLVVANELIDRNFFDHREHIDGDVGVTLFVLLLSFFGTWSWRCVGVAVVRRRTTRGTGETILAWASVRECPASRNLAVGLVSGSS